MLMTISDSLLVYNTGFSLLKSCQTPYPAIKHENIIAYDEKYIHTWPTHPYDAIVELIKKRKSY